MLKYMFYHDKLYIGWGINVFMISKRLMSFVFALVIILFTVNAISAVSPTTLFSDNFNSGGLAGWTAVCFQDCSGQPSSDVGTKSDSSNFDGTSHAYAKDDTGFYNSINTLNYNNIVLGYCRRLDAATGDSLKVGWKTGSSSSNWADWNQLESYTAADWVCVNQSLSSGASNTSILIAFFLDNGNSANGLVENVVVTGTLISDPSPVCGNHVIESGEQCDDGNTQNGDGCSSVCQTEQEAQCVQNWSIGAWGACVSGIQTRTVLDLNSCDNTTGMPATTQACSLVALPTCSVDYLKGSSNFNITANPFINKTGYYSVHGYANANSASCTIKKIEFNRTSSNFIIGSWDPTGSSTISNFYWKTSSYSDNNMYDEGNHTVCCLPTSQICDGSNNCAIYTGNANCTTFCIDTQAPVISNVRDNFVSDCGGEGRYVNLSSITYNWDVELNGCAPVDYYNVTLYRNGLFYQSNVTNNTNIVFENLPEGTYSAWVSAKDKAGNVFLGTGSTGDIIVDLTNPSVIINYPLNGQWFNSGFNLNESDWDANGLNYCQVSVNSGVWTYTSCGLNNIYSVNVNDLCGDGNVCKDVPVAKRVQDYSCRVNDTSVVVNMDRQGPSINKTAIGLNYLWNNRENPIKFVWEAVLYSVDLFLGKDSGLSFVADDGNGYWNNTIYYNITYANGTIVTGTTGVNNNSTSIVRPVADGVYNVTYWAVDGLGNVGQIKHEQDKVDTIAPVTVKTIGVPQYNNGSAIFVTSATNFTLACNDSEVGCDYTQYKIDDGDWNEGNLFNIKGEGCFSHFVEYNSVDLLGNVEVAKNETDWLDNDGPTIEIINPTLWELNRTDCYLNVVATIADGCSGVGSVPYAEIRYENGTVAIPAFVLNLNYPLSGGYSNTVDTTILPVGNYTLIVYAQDHLGNNNTDVKNFVLNPGIHVQYVSPASCSVPIGSSGSCLFTFNACIRGSDTINMYMEKLGRDHNVDPGQVNATLSNSLGSAQVGIWQTDGFYYATNLSLINDSCQNVNGWVSFNMTMSLNSSHSTILGGNYRVNYTINSFDNNLCK